MKFVIAGASGLIGSAIVNALRNRHHAVTVLTRHAPSTAIHRDPGVDQVQWDAQHEGPWIGTLEGADAVLNLAGASIGDGRWTARRKDQILLSRITSTRLLVEGMKRCDARPRALISASGIDFYGPVPHGRVREDHPAGNSFLASVCAQWEAEAARASDLGVRVVLMRTAFVLAPGAPALERFVLPFRLFLGGVYGSGEQWFPWIHISDVASAYVEAALNDTYIGPTNVTAPELLTTGEFCHLVGRAMRRPTFLSVPAPLLRLVLGEMADLLLHGQPAVPEKLQNLGYRFRFPSALAALQDVLGRRKP